MSKQKVLPNNRNAEIAVLGAMLLNVSCISRVKEKIDSEDMYYEINQSICRAFYALDRKSNPVTIDDWLRKSGIKENGSVGYLAEIMEAVSTSAGVLHYCDIVKGLSNRRKLIASCMDTANKAYSEKEDYGSLLQDLQISLLKYQPENRSNIIQMKDALSSTLKSVEEVSKSDKSITGITSGLAGLDNHTSGWQGGELIILAGRPGHGKSVLAKDFAEAAGVPVLYFTLEMSVSEIQKRELAGYSQVPLWKIRTGKLNDRDWEKIIKATDKLNKISIHYVDTGYLTIQELIGILSSAIRKYDIGMVVIDYLQLIKKNEKIISREQEIADISRTLKSTARQYNIPIICVAQLNRQCEQRERTKRRPILSDLRESGAIEQDADIVMFLYLPSLYYNSMPESYTELILAKGRNIKTGTFELYFDGEHQVFRNAEIA